MRPLLCVSVAAVFATAAPAIVIRHDLEQSAYLASESRFPQLFALYRTKKGHRDCIATLISPLWAVTAAHCTEDASFIRSLEGAGYEVDFGGRRAVLDRVIHHPGEKGQRTPVSPWCGSRPPSTGSCRCRFIERPMNVDARS